jgi:hypothetical protein
LASRYHWPPRGGVSLPQQPQKGGTMPRKRTQANEQEPETTREPGDETEQETRAPNPRPWAHNNAAGVEMLEHRDPYERWIRFRDGKPPQEVIDCLKDNGFRWNRDDQVWTRPVDYKTQAQDRLTADRTYARAVDMLLEHKGIAAGQSQDEGISF